MAATMLAMNMNRLHLRSARNWSEMSDTRTLSQLHPYSRKSTSRWASLCEPIVRVRVVHEI